MKTMRLGLSGRLGLSLLLTGAPGCALAVGLDQYRIEDASVGDATPEPSVDHLLTVEDLLGGSIAITIEGGDTTTCTPTAPCDSIVVPDGAMLTLRATGETGRAFRTWTGVCNGETTNVCRITSRADGRVGAVFDVREHLVAFDRVGSGTGTVRTTDDRFVCDDAGCDPFLVPHGTRLDLSAEAALGSSFAGWDVAGCDASPTCTVEITAPTTLAADFSVSTYPLEVRMAGRGSVSGMGIACVDGAGDCAQTLAHGTAVSLTATPGAGHVFSGWEGCDGEGAAGDCELTLRGARTIGATFSPLRGVNVGTSGRGTVRSLPAGISCGDGGACTADFSAGATVSLAPIADAGHHFVAWSADCGGATCACTGTTPSCSFVVGATALYAVALFEPDAHTITLTRSGTGAALGVLREGGAEVCSASACPVVSTATERVHAFTAIDDVRVRFDGWRCVLGDCAACEGTMGACAFTVTGDSALEARFTERTYGLSIGVVARGGAVPPATGTAVLGDDEVGLAPLVVGEGIACGGVGADCNETLVAGARVRLTLSAPWLRLVTWGSPACSDALDTCDLTIGGDVRLDIALEQVGNLAFVTSTRHAGDFGGTRGLDEARLRCEEAARAANLPIAAYRAMLATGTADDRGPAWQLLEGSGDRAGGPRAGWGAGWVNVLGRPVASSVADVGLTRFVHPLLTEAGELLPAGRLAWTGAHGGAPPAYATGITMPTPLPAGYPAGATSYARCGDPSAAEGWDRTALPGMTLYGGVGAPAALGSALFGATPPPPLHVPVGTGAPSYPNVQNCVVQNHLYCFESSTLDVPPPAPPPIASDAIVMFAHRDGVMSTGGIGGVAAMDADCAADASARGLTGRYVAFVSTTTSSAMSRVRLTGSVQRPDGWLVVDDVAALADPATLVRTNPGGLVSFGGGPFEANRGYIAITGFPAAGPGAVATENCADFTSASPTGTTAYGVGDGVYFSRWAREGTIPCDRPYPMTWYCIRAE